MGERELEKERKQEHIVTMLFMLSCKEMQSKQAKLEKQRVNAWTNHKSNQLGINTCKRISELNDNDIRSAVLGESTSPENIAYF